MDSASKAIIIAGGVLISLMVISISMYMIAAGRAVYEQSMDQFEADQVVAFNSYFLQFKPQIKGYDAYNIIGKIIDINANEEAIYTVKLNSTVTRDDFYYTETFMKDYTYSYKYDSSGLISEVTIGSSEKPAEE
ncbi:MAG: hypothetical protein J6C46_01065 [Clostridia bacterium]|nr:hypothetical protein [Clostridia bacterium]